MYSLGGSNEPPELAIFILFLYNIFCFFYLFNPNPPK